MCALLLVGDVQEAGHHSSVQFGLPERAVGQESAPPEHNAAQQTAGPVSGDNEGGEERGERRVAWKNAVCAADSASNLRCSAARNATASGVRMEGKPASITPTTANPATANDDDMAAPGKDGRSSNEQQSRNREHSPVDTRAERDGRRQHTRRTDGRGPEECDHSTAVSDETGVLSLPPSSTSQPRAYHVMTHR